MTIPHSKPRLPEHPNLRDTWLISTPLLRVWVKAGDEPPQRPYSILIASSNMGFLIIWRRIIGAAEGPRAEWEPDRKSRCRAENLHHTSLEGVEIDSHG